MTQRAFLYFALAALPALTQADHAPADLWSWAKFLLVALYQGLLALKALDSPSPGQQQAVTASLAHLTDLATNPIPQNENPPA